MIYARLGEAQRIASDCDKCNDLIYNPAWVGIP